MIGILTRFIPFKAWLVLGAAAVIAAAVLWLRWDAVRDAEVRAKARADQARIEHLEGAKERRNDIEQMDDDSLLDSLLGRLRPDSDD